MLSVRLRLRRVCDIDVDTVLIHLIMCIFLKEKSNIHDLETSRIGRLQASPDVPRCFPGSLRTHTHVFRSNFSRG